MLVNREHDIFKLLALVEQQSQNQSYSVKNETMQNQQNITFDRWNQRMIGKFTLKMS